MSSRTGQLTIGAAVAGALLIVVTLALHLYAGSRAADAARGAVETLDIEHIALINMLENPERWLYRITLRAGNDSDLNIPFRIHDSIAMFGGTPLVVVPLGQWETTLLPGAAVDFNGDVILFQGLHEQLRSEPSFPVSVHGRVDASARYLWVERSEGREYTAQSTMSIE